MAASPLPGRGKEADPGSGRARVGPGQRRAPVCRSQPDRLRCNMAKSKGSTTPRQAARATATRQIARNAVKGGPKDVRKNKRVGGGRRAKG